MGMILLTLFILTNVAIIIGIFIYYKISPIYNMKKLNKETVLLNPFYCRHIIGLDISDNALCTIYFTNENIVISQVKDKRILKSFSIANNKVLAVDEDTIVEKKLISGDSIGNALLGGLLFGGIGAVVGATSGNNVQDIKQDIDVIKIKYSSDTEDKCILLSCEDTFMYKKFIKQYNKFILKVTNKEIENVKL